MNYVVKPGTLRAMPTYVILLSFIKHTCQTQTMNSCKVDNQGRLNPFEQLNLVSVHFWNGGTQNNKLFENKLKKQLQIFWFSGLLTKKLKKLHRQNFYDSIAIFVPTERQKQHDEVFNVYTGTLCGSMTLFEKYLKEKGYSHIEVWDFTSFANLMALYDFPSPL